MSKRVKLTCKDCYFSQLALCALQLDAPCPTFRLLEHGVMAAPRQAPLVPRPFDPIVPVLLAENQAA